MFISIFNKNSSLAVSETFFNELSKKFENKGNINCFSDGTISSQLDVFSNCREQGYCLSLFDEVGTSKSVVYWVCQDRSSEDIMIVTGRYENKDTITNVFDDETFNTRKYFKINEMKNAVDYVYSQIKIMFREKLENSYSKSLTFNTNQPLTSLRRIADDVDNLVYSDYYDLATYEDKTEQYANDLIIRDGKFYFRISKTDGGDYENIGEVPCEPNLESEDSLMQQMKESLNKYIDEELKYKISI